MNVVKIVLIALGLIVAAMLALSVFSILYTALWYLFFIGILAVGGAVGYKLLTRKKQTPQLQDNMPIGISEINNADRVLEEYKRKSLPK